MSCCRGLIGYWLLVAAGLAFGNTLEVIPGRYFVEVESTVRVDVKMASPDLLAIRFDSSWNDDVVEYVADSAATAPGRVIPGFFQTFTLLEDNTKLRFLTDNPSGDASVKAGDATSSLFRFDLRATALGRTELNPTFGGDVFTPAGQTVATSVSDVDGIHTYRIDGRPAAVTSSTELLLKIAATTITHYRFSFDGGAYSGETPIATPISLSGLANGIRTVRILLKDEDGNWQDEADAIVVQWTVDSAVPAFPTLNGSVPAVGGPFMDGVGITLDWIPEADAASHSYNWSVSKVPNETIAEPDGSIVTLPSTVPAASFDAGDGAYYVHLRVRGTQTTGTTHYGPFFLDTVPPVAALNNPPAPVTSNRFPSFTVNGSDAVAYRYEINGSGFSAETAIGQPIGLTLGFLGNHLLRIITKDAAGNWQAMDEATEYAWTVDALAPTAPATPPFDPLPGAGVRTRQPNLTVSMQDPATDQGSGIAGYSILVQKDPNPAPGAFPAGAQPDAATLPAMVSLDQGDGTYYVTAVIFDAAGNGTFTSWGPWILDTQAPAAPVLSGISDDTGSDATDGITMAQTLAISGTAEAGSTVELFRAGISIGTVVAADGTFTFDYSGTTLAEGTHRFTAKATDLAGNEGGASSELVVEVDLTPPSVSIERSPDKAIFNGDYALSVAVSDGTIEYSVDGGASFLQYSVAVPFSDEDVYTFDAHATDVAGNVGNATQATFEIDLTAPDLSISAPAQGSEVRGTAAISVSGGETAAEVSVDGTNWKLLAEVSTLADVPGFADLLEGDFSLRVRDTDAAGNVGMATVGLVKDTVAPIVSIVLDPASGISGTQVAVTIEGDGDEELFYELDGASPTAYSGNEIIEDGKGDHSISAFAVDAAGNRGTAGPVTFSLLYRVTGTVAYANLSTAAIRVELYEPADGSVIAAGTASAESGAFELLTENTGAYAVQAYLDLIENQSMDGDEAADVDSVTALTVDEDLSDQVDLSLTLADWRVTWPRDGEWQLVSLPGEAFLEFENSEFALNHRYGGTLGWLGRRWRRVSDLQPLIGHWLRLKPSAEAESAYLRGNYGAAMPLKLSRGWSAAGVALPTTLGAIDGADVAWRWDGRHWLKLAISEELMPGVGYWIYSSTGSSN